MMTTRNTILSTLVVLALLLLVFNALTPLVEAKGDQATSGPLGDLGRFIRSQDIKTDVTIFVVGAVSVIAGFGARDVIARRRQRRLNANH